MARTPTDREAAFEALQRSVSQGDRIPGQSQSQDPGQQTPKVESEHDSAGSIIEDPELREFSAMEEFSLEPTSRNVLVRIASPLVPKLVGKSGAGIRELQNLSGASVNVSKDGAVHIARISGTFPETHLCAILVAQRLTPRDHSARHTRLSALAAYFRSKCERAHVVEPFAVPVEHVGRVFGWGGRMLREVQELSRAKIEIPRESVPSEHARVLHISGTREAVQTCAAMLRARMARDDTADHAVPLSESYVPESKSFVPDKSSHESYSRPPPSYPSYNTGQYPYAMFGPAGHVYAAPPAHHYDQYGYVVPTYAGYPGPYPGYGFVPMVPAMTSAGGPYYDTYSDQLSADMSRVSLSPSLDSQDGDHQVPLVLAPPSPHLHARAMPFVPSPGSSPGQHAFYHPQMGMVPVHVPHMMGMHPGAGPGMGMHPAVNMQHEIVMAVPAELIGRLIGRQGVAVKQLQAETKTRVDVIDADATTPSGTRYVRITALRQEHLQACQSQIQARIAAHFGTQ